MSEEGDAVFFEQRGRPVSIKKALEVRAIVSKW
jgi:hypothetical protein